jgi:hypothetical protein
MHELIKQRPEADWVDQDLLIRDLAAALLDEIAAQRDALDHLSAAATRTRARQRLDSMITVRRGLTGPSGDQQVAACALQDEKG